MTHSINTLPLLLTEWREKGREWWVGLSIPFLLAHRFSVGLANPGCHTGGECYDSFLGGYNTVRFFQAKLIWREGVASSGSGCRGDTSSVSNVPLSHSGLPYITGTLESYARASPMVYVSRRWGLVWPTCTHAPSVHAPLSYWALLRNTSSKVRLLGIWRWESWSTVSSVRLFWMGGPRWLVGAMKQALTGPTLIPAGGWAWAMG